MKAYIFLIKKINIVWCFNIIRLNLNLVHLTCETPIFAVSTLCSSMPLESRFFKLKMTWLTL